MTLENWALAFCFAPARSGGGGGGGTCGIPKAVLVPRAGVVSSL